MAPKSEQRQDELAIDSRDLPAEGHAFIFYEMDERPVLAQDGKLLSDLHMGLDPDLQGLVDDQNHGKSPGG